MTVTRQGGRRHLAIGLVSAALVAFQIVLLQLLATSQWHHFAYLVISVALLGFGAAGTLLTLTRQWLLARQQVALPLLMGACAVSLVAPLGVAQALFGGFDSYLLFVDAGEALRLAAVALLLMLPFGCGALAVGLVFTAETERIGSYYFANLSGSGLGSVLGLLGLSFLTPERLLPCCALLALLAGALLLAGQSRWLRGLLLAGVLPIVLVLVAPPVPALSQYKALRLVLDLPDARVIARQPSAAGQVHVVASEVLRSAPGVSLKWQGALPPRPAVFVNGDGIGSVPFAADGANPLDASTSALAYALQAPDKVLVLDAGTGAGVGQALARGARRVVAVEARTVVGDVLQAVAPADYGRLVRTDRVSWHGVSARTWLARDRESYDLIVLPTVGVIGGNAGLSALHEQPLLTVEALRQAWRHLAAQGLLTVTVWVDYPVRSPLRLLASLVEALQAEGVATPADHLAAVRGWGTLTFCVKREPLSAGDRTRLLAFTEQWGFDPLLLPGLSAQQRQRYHRLQDASLLSLLDTVLTSARTDLYRDYAFRVYPVSDDRPFFSQFLRWNRLAELTRLYGQRGVPFLEMGLLIAALAAAVLIVLALLLIVLPLACRPGTDWGRSTLCYFSGLGVGYMWVELALIHRFALYLGQPVLAVALVIAVLMVGSGVGSALSSRLNAARPGRWAAAVAGLLLLYALLLGTVLQTTLPLLLPLRILVTVLVLTPVAVLMGLPFPLGLRLLDRVRPASVPWAWGINGCLSVVATVVATLLAVEVGFGALLLLAALVYLLPALARLA